MLKRSPQQPRFKAWTTLPQSAPSSRFFARCWRVLLHRVGDASHWLSLRFGSQRSRAAHLITGERGEDLVFWHIQHLGWKVLAQRWRSPTEHGDIDLVALDETTLCFIEVKTRTSRGMIPAHLAVDAEKRAMLRTMAKQYIRSLPFELRNRRSRFDIAEVYLIAGQPESITLRRNAFGWSNRRPWRDRN